MSQRSDLAGENQLESDNRPDRRSSPVNCSIGLQR
jgi:hypothetical protein